MEQNNNLLLYPNPATISVNLEIPDGMITQYLLSDIKGGVLINKDGLNTSRTTINVADLANGIYLLKVVNSAGATFIKKLVVLSQFLMLFHHLVLGNQRGMI